MQAYQNGASGQNSKRTDGADRAGGNDGGDELYTWVGADGKAYSFPGYTKRMAATQGPLSRIGVSFNPEKMRDGVPPLAEMTLPEVVEQYVQMKAQEMQIKEQELEIKKQQIVMEAQYKLQELETQRMEAAAQVQEQELRYAAETERTSADTQIAHADNLVKILTHKGPHHQQHGV